MEFKTHHHHHQYEASTKTITNPNCSNSVINSQVLSNLNRNVVTGFNQFGSDYGHDISFADSPSSSEKAWTEEISKGSPRLQITDIQTLYYNTNGSLKRRFDWDLIDINQNGNQTQNQQPESRKEKREKLSGRGWNDDIGFELGNDFNSNSYLNNDHFMPISPGLTVLKKDAQSTEPAKINIKTTTSMSNNNNNNSNNNNTNNNNGNNTNNIQLNDNDGQQLKTERLSITSAIQPTTTTTATNPTYTDTSARNAKVKSPHEFNNHSGNTIIVRCNDNTNSNSPTQEFETSTNLHSSNSNSNSNSNGTTRSCTDACKVNGDELTTQITEIQTSKNDKFPNAIVPHTTDDHKFQYILAAATSIATKNNEETLTYLNQGQSYEIKLKKTGDLSFYRDKILKSYIKICFHERRLQFIEREQMQQWQMSRPGERLIEVDVPLSYGLCNVVQPLGVNQMNMVEITWDPFKEVGVYIKVNCISTEFTPKKHGGEKGVPFRLQIETYIEKKNSLIPNDIPMATQSTNSMLPIIGNRQPLSAAACQIKVFKLKGADRKHKQDREKMQKRPQSEQEKYQPSYECTIMNDIPLELIATTAITTTTNGGDSSPEYMKVATNSPIYGANRDGILYASTSPAHTASPVTENSISSTNSPTMKLLDSNNLTAQQTQSDVYDTNNNIMPESTPTQVAQWLTHHRLNAYLSTFTHFSGSDVMRMTKEDLIQICGIADGIRMFNCLRAKAIAPRLTIYVCFDPNNGNYNAVFLISSTTKELTQKLLKIPGFYDMIANNANNGSGLDNGTLYNGMHSKFSYSGSNIYNDGSGFICLSGPSGVHVTLTDEVLNNEVKDGSLYTLEVQNGKVIMKLSNRNEN